jgi:hypothetical protein
MPSCTASNPSHDFVLVYPLCCNDDRAGEIGRTFHFMTRHDLVLANDTLSLDEFLRRLLLHVLPKGFVRIRHFGFLANRRRATFLPLCLQLLGALQPSHTQPEASPAQEASPLPLCPTCGGRMMVIERLTAAQIQLRSPPSIAGVAA